MKMSMHHKFFIPVMGTGFTIDTPLYVAKYGISSVISLVDDVLIEKMRKHYSHKYDKSYIPIKASDKDARAKRITSYLNLIHTVVDEQFRKLKEQTFAKGTELRRYFELLPDSSELKKNFIYMDSLEEGEEKVNIQEKLKDSMTPGEINVNIMTKLDKENYYKGEKLSGEYSDALSALRGFAMSDLSSAIVFSAGLNRTLYSYTKKFSDFFADTLGNIKKRIVIKVSDFRSAVIQGKFFAKLGIWVSEYRVESGINCGGHAFVDQGALMGPVLQEFKENKDSLRQMLLDVFLGSLKKNNIEAPSDLPDIMITAQGGIGTFKENELLLDFYKVDATGWGSPFLLVPEVTSVDDQTIQSLVMAKENDIYLSETSPLGVPFNSIRNSTGEIAKEENIKNGIFGSSCPKRYLSINTELTEHPICVSSREYQEQKIEQLKSKGYAKNILDKMIRKVVNRSCICHELGGPALIKHNISSHEKIKCQVCPGPNIAYFNRTYSLQEMVSHIYGRIDLLSHIERSHMFINELKLYVDYFKTKISDCLTPIAEKEQSKLISFYNNLIDGIEYYKKNLPELADELVRIKKYLDQLFSGSELVSTAPH